MLCGVYGKRSSGNGVSADFDVHVCEGNSANPALVADVGRRGRGSRICRGDSSLPHAVKRDSSQYVGLADYVEEGMGIVFVIFRREKNFTFRVGEDLLVRGEPEDIGIDLERGAFMFFSVPRVDAIAVSGQMDDEVLA